MKKRLLSIGLIAVLGLTSILMMTGCGEKTPYSGYDLSEYVKVGEYKGLEYTKTAVSVSENEIQDEIKKRCEAAATTKDVEEGVVADGDTLSIGYKGKIDGKTNDKLNNDEDTLTIGSGRMIDGFEDGLIGKSVGETVTLNLKFPKDYHDKKAAGKDVVFDVTIHSKQVKVVPEYNLDFVKAHSSFDNLKDYEASVKKDLLKKKTSDADIAVKNGLWEQIIKKSKALSYPEEKDKLVDTMLNAYKDEAKSNNMKWEKYLDTIGVSEDEIKKTAETYAKNTVFQEMVLYSIAEKEGIEVSNDEYKDFKDNMLKQSGLDDDTFKSTYGMSLDDYCEQKGFRTSLLLNKVMDKVMEYGKAVEK